MRSTSASALISRLNTADRQLLLQHDVLHDVHRQRRLAHRRPRRDHDHFAAVQAVRHAVQIREAGRQPGQAALLLEEFFNRLDRLLTRSFIVRLRP